MRSHRLPGTLTCVWWGVKAERHWARLVAGVAWVCVGVRQGCAGVTKSIAQPEADDQRARHTAIFVAGQFGCFVDGFQHSVVP